AASAHALLLQSDPAPGSLLQAAPAAITLVFSEQVTPAGAGIKVFSPSGSQVAGRVGEEGAVLSASLASAEVGTYVVSWQVFAADTHPSRGAFAFSVGHPSANPYSGLLGTGEAGTSTPLGLALQALARWIHFIGFALTFGVVAYGALIKRASAPLRLVGAGLVLAPARRFGRYALGTLATAIGTGLLLAFAHTHFGAALISSGYGQVLMVKVLVLGAALAALRLRRHRGELALATLVIGAAALVAALPPPI